MSTKTLTCIECPIGCLIEVTMQDGVITDIKGNTCPRGKLYAENEMVCPRRVVTSTVKGINGKMIPVKTDKPIKKSEMFEVMKKINTVICDKKVKIGDIVYENISEDIHLIVSGNV